MRTPTITRRLVRSRRQGSLWRGCGRGRWAIAALFALLVACGNGRVILNLDILSFMDASQTASDYGVALAPAPLSIPPGLLSLSTQVNLVDGLGSVTAVAEGTITLGARLDNRKGRASNVQLAVFLAPTQAEVSSPTLAPAFALPVTPATVAPDSTTLVMGTIPLDAATLDLFTGDQVWIRVGLSGTLAAGAPGDSLAGRATLTEFTAHIIAGENVF